LAFKRIEGGNIYRMCTEMLKLLFSPVTTKPRILSRYNGFSGKRVKEFYYVLIAHGLGGRIGDTEDAFGKTF
jgi:hypothetical protein